MSNPALRDGREMERCVGRRPRIKALMKDTARREIARKKFGGMGICGDIARNLLQDCHLAKKSAVSGRFFP
ncbi:MAG: hypothetical protein J0G36_01015 [Afipia sp.]|nr:hypothetical protein [Afipia sp.]